MAEEPAFVPLRLGSQGRVVIPAHFRRAEARREEEVIARYE